MIKINKNDLKNAFRSLFTSNIKSIVISNPVLGRPGEVLLFNTINTIYNISDNTDYQFYYPIEDLLEEYDKIIINTFLNTQDFNRLNNYIQKVKFKTLLSKEVFIYEEY